MTLFTGLRRTRGRHLFLLDVAGAFGASLLAAIVTVRGGPITDSTIVASAAVTLVVVAAAVRLGLYSRLWMHASVPDLVQIIRVAAVGIIASALIVTFVLRPFANIGSDLGVAFWIVNAQMVLAILAGPRFALRAIGDFLTTRSISGTRMNRLPALLYGTGRDGALIARSTLHDPRSLVLPVGFLEAHEGRDGSFLADLPVYGGLGHLEEAVRSTGARMLLITYSNADGAEIRAVMAAAQAARLEVRRVPAVHELVEGSLDPTRIRRIRVEDLLSREQVTDHAPGVDEIIRDRVVMVTGAGGSIGSELARQIHSLGPRRLILVDRAESPLYMIRRELELDSMAAGRDVELSVHLANVVSLPAMRRLFAAERPSVVFHAAAYKHVPMMEEHPSESVHVNVGGTRALLEAAIDAEVERFVLVSTDKAVEPSSVMGATKRLAELLVADAAARTGRSFVAVRFGNVLGSAGSVLPLFERQLERGEPLTVTHRDMTRYFMTIQEAGWLILDASVIGEPGDLFVLDMGAPVKIIDMARDLVRLSGRDPEEVPVVFIGLRPGEKLTEKLYYDSETVRQTDVPRILRVLDRGGPSDAISRVDLLLALATGDRDLELREALFAAVADRSRSSVHMVPSPEVEAHHLPTSGAVERDASIGETPAAPTVPDETDASSVGGPHRRPDPTGVKFAWAVGPGRSRPPGVRDPAIAAEVVLER